MSESEVSMVNLVMSMSSPSPSKSLATSTLGQTLASCGNRRKRDVSGSSETTGNTTSTQATTTKPTKASRKKKNPREKRNSADVQTCPSGAPWSDTGNFCYGISMKTAGSKDGQMNATIASAAAFCKNNYTSWSGQADLIEFGRTLNWRNFQNNVIGNKYQFHIQI